MRLGLLVHHAHLEIRARLPDSDAKLYYREAAVWEEVSRALSRLIDAYPSSGWGHNSLAFIAGQASQKAVALHEFRWIGRRWDPSVWDELGEFDRFRSWVLITAGPAASRAETH